MNAELRMLTRIIGETFRGINRAGWMNIIIITTMAAILSIFGCLFRTSLFITTLVDGLGDSMQVSIYLKQGRDIEQLKQKIVSYKNIKSIKVVTKEEAWKKMKEQLDLSDIDNVLPDKIQVSLHERSQIDGFVAAVKKMDGVDDVFYAKELADQITRAGYYTNIISIVVIILLCGFTFFIINNTIHLVIESRKREIEIMQMMGGANWYIKAPYILQGAFYGFWAGILAIIPIFILSFYLNKLSDFFFISYLYLNTNIVILVTLAAGITAGAAGSVVSVRKYLKI